MALFFLISYVSTAFSPRNTPILRSPALSRSLHKMNYLHAIDPFLGFDIGPREYFKINYESKKAARETDRFLSFLETPQGEDALGVLRAVSIVGYSSIANWTLALSVLSKASNLARVDWQINAHISSHILRSLEEARPYLRLFYTIPFGYSALYDPYVPEKEQVQTMLLKEREEILGSTILHAVKGSIGYGERHNPQDMALVQSILTTCPNLKQLDLTVRWDGGCRVGREQPYAFDFSSSSAFHNKRIATLESIKLDGYRLDNMPNGYRLGGERTKYALTWPFSFFPTWFTHRIGYEDLRRIGIAQVLIEGGKDAESTNLDGWLSHMDWSQVHSLDLDSMSANSIKKLQPVLTNLSSLSVRYAGCCAATAWHELLSSTAHPMTSISLKNVQRKDFDQTVEMTVSRHSSTITSLALGEWDGFREYQGEWENGMLQMRSEPHVYLTPGHLKTLAGSCHSLVHLDIDLNRTSLTSLDNDVLDVLPDFALNSLTLRLESPDMQYRRAHPDQMYIDWRMQTLGRDRIINAMSVQALFHNLRMQQQSRWSGKAPSLTSLEMFVGKWESRHSHGMSAPAKHLAGYWKCWVDAEGKEACEGENTLPSYWTLGCREDGIDDGNEEGYEDYNEDGEEELAVRD